MLDRQLEIVREDLHRRYGQLASEETIDAVLEQVTAEQRAEAHVETFLPVLVERATAERLEQMADALGEHKACPRKEVLFVCERNAGRSQLASAVATWLAGEEIFVRSVGLHPVGGINPVVVEVLAERGIPTDHLYQKEITPRAVHRADVVVLMGVDEVPGVPGDRYIHWDIADPEGSTPAAVAAILDTVIAHVRALLVELEIPLKDTVHAA